MPTTKGGPGCSIVDMILGMIAEGARSFDEVEEMVIANLRGAGLSVDPKSVQRLNLKAAYEKAAKKYVQGPPAGLRDLLREEKLAMSRELMKLRRSTTREAATGLARAGMLTGGFLIRTLTGNAIGNTSEIALDYVDRLPSTILDMLASTVSGKRSISTKGSFSSLSGLVSKEAGQRMVQIIRNGASDADLERYDVPREVQFFAPTDVITNGVMRVQAAADVPYRVRAFRRAILERATLKAMNEGKGEDYVRELIQSPPPELLDMVNKDVLEDIFANENWASAALKGAQASITRGSTKVGPLGRAAGEVVNFALDMAVPFARIPGNVATRLAERTPLGAIVGLAETVIAAGAQAAPNGRLAEWVERSGWDALEMQRRGTKRFGRSITGTGLVVSGYALAQSGLITATPGPSDKSKRETMEALGETPASFAITIGGETRHYRATDSVAGMLLALGGSIWHRQNGDPMDKTPESLSHSLVASAGNVASSQPAIEGVRRLTEAVADPETRGDSFLASAARGLTPLSGMARDVAGWGDPNKKATKGVAEGIQQNIPGKRDELATLYDALGDPVRQGHPLNRLGAIPAKVDPVRDEIRALKVNISKAALNRDPEDADVDKTTHDHMDRVRFVGKRVYDALLDLVQDPDYRSLPLKERREAFTDAYRSSKREATTEYKGRIQDSFDEGQPRPRLDPRDLE